MKFSDFNFKLNTDYNIVKIGDKEVKVLQYLPISDKIDLVQIALQKSQENGIYNVMKLDVYFNLYIVYMYTDLEFTEEEKADEFALYDQLETNGVFLDVIGAIPTDEYESLLTYLKELRDANNSYRNSAAALIQSFIQDLPRNAAAAANIVDNFDKEKYQNVLDFAKAANGDRPIPIEK